MSSPLPSRSPKERIRLLIVFHLQVVGRHQQIFIQSDLGWKFGRRRFDQSQVNINWLVSRSQTAFKEFGDSNFEYFSAKQRRHLSALMNQQPEVMHPQAKKPADFTETRTILNKYSYP